MAARAPGAGASLDEWLRWQEAQHPQAIALGLDRVRSVAARLRLPEAIPTITVAGTNGKGSTTHLLSEIYGAAGYRVGRYTSPHLLRYNERIALDGHPVDDGRLVRAFAEVEAARGETPLTYFEYGTLAALLLFAHAEVQVQVLEVGLGGRLDAVNLIDADVAVVTSIGIDHVEYLGSTREAIGREKAGIFRPQQPAVCADPDPPASVAEHAKAVNTSLWQLGRDFGYQHAADAWNWWGPERRFKKLPLPALPGAIQVRNAAAAVAVVERLQARLTVPEIAVRAGLARLRLPGRFERRQLPDGAAVVFDVAHNVEAAHVLADNLRSLTPGAARIVIGMLSDKPVEEFYAALAAQAVHFHAAGLPGPRGLPAAVLAGRIRTVTDRVSQSATVADAVAEARAALRTGETLVVCGSFLTVAAAVSALHG